jgi:hypothetical protein
LLITTLILAGCDEARMTYDLYGDVQPERFSYLENSWLIFLRPIDSRLMIVPSTKLAAKNLIVSKASFGLASDEESFSKSAEYAAIHFIKNRFGETCAIRSQIDGFAPKFEFTYYCN